jgi:cytochrome c1
MTRSTALRLASGCAAAVALAGLSGGCRDDLATKAAMVTGGDPHRGKAGIRTHGCAACHSVPGVPGANALVGPPLDHMASRAYVAGTLPNSPDNMREWLMHPQKIKPKNAMPDVGLTDADARDITAYLYTLE